jgi:hypothetical protein
MTESLKTVASRVIPEKVKTLLKTKHLYQSISVDLVSDGFDKVIKADGEREASKVKIPMSRLSAATIPRSLQMTALKQKAATKALQVLNGPWRFDAEVANHRHALPTNYVVVHGSDELRFTLPPIRINCEYCKNTLQPHNSGYIGANQEVVPVNVLKDNGTLQIFQFPYQCQGCRGEPVVFQVRRQGMKLTLTGRSRIEKVPVPPYIPEQESEYFCDAMIAFNSGRVLAGLFFQRTLVEQYMRRVLNAQGRLTGDELGDMYAKILADDFPRRFKSLKTIFSERLHAANADAALFESVQKDIGKHFELLGHFPLRGESQFFGLYAV